MLTFSLYLHIPFCHYKCPYCDFNTYALATFPEKEYVSALLSELDYRASLPEWKGRTVQTIYFGGGTPSLFSPASLRKIISVIIKTFPVDERVEITLEANPGNLPYDTIYGFKEAGINRLSLGAQSFLPETLKALGRLHTPEQIEASIETARSVGLTNLSIDIMYGAPGQSVKDVESDLKEISRIDPPHVSPYGLTIEKGTPFFTSFKKGVLKLPKEKHLISMMEIIEERLKALGILQYEISNFAKPGREARHNLAYWNGDDYLGLGAGAHSFNRQIRTNDNTFGRRWSNFAPHQRYITEATGRGIAESWSEDLDEKNALFEHLFLGLRKTEGVSLSVFEKLFKRPLISVYPAVIEALVIEGLMTQKEDRLALSAKGRMLADSVIENFASPENLSTSSTSEK